MRIALLTLGVLLLGYAVSVLGRGFWSAHTSRWLNSASRGDPRADVDDGDVNDCAPEGERAPELIWKHIPGTSESECADNLIAATKRERAA